MPVLFKFRSSVGFDAVDLGGRPSISVRDLRARVVEQKNLQICADSRLVVFDACTGEAYEDEEFMIPDGSSVIIKRVPAAPFESFSLLISLFSCFFYSSVISFECSGSYVLSFVVSGNGGAAGIGHAAAQEDFLGALVSSPSEHVAMDNFDDFGNDLLPAVGTLLQESDSDSDDRSINSFKRRKSDDYQRCSESPVSRCQNQEMSNLSEAFSKENVGENYDVECDAKDNVKQSNLQQKQDENRKLAKAVDESSPVMPSMDLPTELQCSLCNKIFKEAVMIPCCQHSFCDKCIRTTLVDKGCCPKCSSSKCRIEDLLPNLSLRHAIEHFLEAQIPILSLDKVTPIYAPDGESGIQAKEASCALSIRQLEHTLPQSPSVTGKGSNQVVALADSTCESLTGMKRMAPGTCSNTSRLDGDKPPKSIILLHKDRRLNEKDDGQDSKHVPCFEQHGSFIKAQRIPQKEEATSATKKKKGLFATSADASGATMLPPSRLKKGERKCFMCGSPDHLIRDCPAASNPYHLVQTGNAPFHGGMPAYGAAYWHNNSFPYMRPYANMYGTPGMLPFDPSINSVPPFGISYMSPMYAGLPVSWMGGMGPPMMTGASRPFSHADVIEFQDGEQRHTNLKEHMEREEAFDEGDNFVDDHYYPDSRRRVNDHKAQIDKGVARSCSDEEGPRVHRKHAREGYLHASSHQRPTSTSEDEEIHSGSRKHEKASNIAVSGRDSRTHYSERSYSYQQDDSDSSDQHREKSKHRHKSSPKKQSEKRGKHNSDHIHKSQSRSWRETCDDGEKIMSDHKKHIRKHLGHSEVTFVLDSSGDQKQSLKEEISHSPRHTKRKEKLLKDQLEDDRWELVDGSDEVYGSDHWYHKHRRTR